jgi:glycerol-3-phosphate dehydrogenase
LHNVGSEFLISGPNIQDNTHIEIIEIWKDNHNELEALGVLATEPGLEEGTYYGEIYIDDNRFVVEKIVKAVEN